MFHDGPVKNEPNVQVHLEPKHQGDGEELRNEAVIPVKWSAVRAIITYTWILALLQWVSVQEQASNSLSPYVTSQFGDLSISPATSQAAYIISGIIDVPLAKLIEIWGLDLGFAIMMFFNTLGLILLATCKNITAYAAAQVIYEIGFHGIYYVITVFIAETAEKKYRALVLSLTCVPYIAATFAGPSFAQTFHEHSTFRWAYGVLLIVTFFMCLPVLLTMRLHMRAKKASANSLAPPGSKSIVDYFIHFDVIGVVLLCSGLTLFFLPWTLAAKQEESWKSATVLVMIILGFCLILAFVVYEAFLSPKSFVPFSFLRDRNILGACLLLFGWSLSNYCWNTYYRIYLQVVNRLSIATAGYVINIYWDGIAVGSVLAGLVLRFTKNYTLLSLAGLVLFALGTGLLVKFRHADTDLGYIILCQVFIALGAGILTISQYIALMASEVEQSIALRFAFSIMWSKIGIVVGQSISGGTWTNVLPRELHHHLPPNLQPETKAIMGSIEKALSYPPGSVGREAIDDAYSHVQRLLTIIGTSMLAFSFLGVLIWRRPK